MRSRSRIAAFVAIAAAALQSACATFGPEALAVHGVALDPAQSPATARVDARLLVAEPRAVDPVSTARIVLVAPDGEYSVLPRVRWREPAPAIFRSLLIESFEACACVTSAAPTVSAVTGDYLVEIDLRRFELVEASDGPATATAHASLAIVRLRDGKLVAARRFAREEPLGTHGQDSGVAALGRAMNGVVGEARAWIVRALSDAQRDVPES